MTFNLGGSLSNINATHLARFYYNPQINKIGNSNYKFIILCSEYAHYLSG